MDDSLTKNILKRCLSAPLINNGVSNTSVSIALNNMSIATETATVTATAATSMSSTTKSLLSSASEKLSSAVGAVALTSSISNNVPGTFSQLAAATTTVTSHCSSPSRSNSSSREASPAPVFNIFAPRARRYSASYASLGANCGNIPRLTPRVSQLRQEECLDMNSREMNHEREIVANLQISQSWEDLTLEAENWSCKSSDDLSNPLQVTLPSAGAISSASCSSPSPTSRRVILPYGLSPSPTRRTFATRRSMSPPMKPSQLGLPVKRKFELEDSNNSNWSTCSPPPIKKIFTESSRGSSPLSRSPSSVCPSPDSGTYEGRITPKLFIPKLFSSSSAASSPSSSLHLNLNFNSNNVNNCFNNTNSNSASPSLCSSPSMVPSPLTETGIESNSTAISTSSSQEAMCYDQDSNNSTLVAISNDLTKLQNNYENDHKMELVDDIENIQNEGNMKISPCSTETKTEENRDMTVEMKFKSLNTTDRQDDQEYLKQEIKKEKINNENFSNLLINSINSNSERVEDLNSKNNLKHVKAIGGQQMQENTSIHNDKLVMQSNFVKPASENASQMVFQDDMTESK